MSFRENYKFSHSEEDVKGKLIYVSSSNPICLQSLMFMYTFCVFFLIFPVLSFFPLFLSFFATNDIYVEPKELNSS